MGPQAGRKVLTACAARCKQSQLEKKMTLAPASLAGLGIFVAWGIDVSVCSACGGPMKTIAESRTTALTIR